MPTRPTRLAACLTLSVATVTFGQGLEYFEPMESVEGTVTIGYLSLAYFEDACQLDEDTWVESTHAFTPEQAMSLGIPEAEPCNTGGSVASFTSWSRADLLESRPPDYIVAGFEWTLDLSADAASLSGAQVRAEIDFTINRPCRVTLHSTHSGLFEASIGDIQTEFYFPHSGNIIDFDHYDTTVLGPGTHRLSARASMTKDRGTVLDADATVWVRFEDAYCSPADLAEPFGFHDMSDISAFIDAFLAQRSAADINTDGVVDLGDVQQFVEHFLSGCVTP